MKVNSPYVESEHLIQFDIKPDQETTPGNDTMQEKRNAIRDRSRLWYTRDIPYTFGNDGKFSDL